MLQEDLAPGDSFSIQTLKYPALLIVAEIFNRHHSIFYPAGMLKLCRPMPVKSFIEDVFFYNNSQVSPAFSFVSIIELYRSAISTGKSLGARYLQCITLWKSSKLS